MTQSTRTSNRLAEETSAYLRQHMHNPVDWRPWGEEAFRTARELDRPVLVSIGYSACHWCHVMEHESFEDPETAEMMNAHFVSVKVDREERPDVDQIYMDSVIGMHGRGGWPLTVFCKPDGTPFYGGTYFPPEPRHGMPAFREVLTGIDDLWRNRRQQVERNGNQILSGLERRPSGPTSRAPGIESARQAALKLLQQADPEHGGFGRAPKFPTPTSLQLLLGAIDVLPETKAREALDHVVLTCHAMSRGGIYDQLGGGFHRYSVDATWLVPHFEKMLYDQGQLLSVYAETYRRTGCSDADLLWPIRETADFLRREMTGEEGGFVASLDADSEGQEGTFYVWTPSQVEAALGPDAAPGFCSAYDVTDRGNFEHGTTVLRNRAQNPREHFAAERRQLLDARRRRVAPGTDTKRITAWNALAISGLARAASLLDDATLLDCACRAADFVLAHSHDADGRLLRIWNAGRAHVNGFLDDHAAWLEALLELDRAGAGPEYRAHAVRTADAIAAYFFDPDQSDLFLTPNDGETLVHRPRTDHDGAAPHSTGLATLGLLRLATLTGRDDLRSVAARVLATHGFVLERTPEAFPTLARATLLFERGGSVALVIGAPSAAKTRELAAAARRALGPDDAIVVTAPGERPQGVATSWFEGREARDGRPTAYICRGFTCSPPTCDPDAIAPLAAPA
ncbi:MAG: thioredoxin domain-containing protein [Deltaproteobacteria bacterium]|nr:thioredoxin domain-containing protein [Deltaproteobacteria bacterium]